MVEVAQLIHELQRNEVWKVVFVMEVCSATLKEYCGLSKKEAHHDILLYHKRGLELLYNLAMSFPAVICNVFPKPTIFSFDARYTRDQRKSWGETGSAYEGDSNKHFRVTTIDHFQAD